MKFELQALENLINSWTVIFLPNSGEKFNGKLYVTNTRLVYDMQYNISSFQDVIESSYIAKAGENSVLEIPKADIVDVNVEKSFFQKKVIVTVKSGTKFIFSYGMLNADPIAEAIKSV